MNPRINIDLKKLQNNAAVLTKICKESNIKVAAVTKGFCAEPEITEALVAGGVQQLADSRIENLIKLAHIPVEKILLRLPMLSQVNEVVKYADISMNSELETIEALNKAAEAQNKIHRIILMVDLGDLREGIIDDQELKDALLTIKAFKFIKVEGLGTNLTCFGGVLPSDENLARLIALSKEAESLLGYPMEIISGGNSSSVHLIVDRKIPTEINHLRLGETILLGVESARGNKIEGTYQDAFQLVAEIIEVKVKPSVPIGEIGVDAFGNVPVFEEKGNIKRAILAVGKQDIATHPIFPVDKGMEVMGGSSDHLIVDLTHCEREYKVGDEVTFNLGYGSMLALMTSGYVSKNYIK